MILNTVTWATRGGGSSQEEEILLRTISAYDNSTFTGLGAGAFIYCYSLKSISMSAC